MTTGGGSSGGTQYAEGTTTTPATGNVGLGRFNSTPVTVANGALNAMAIDANANTIVVGGVPQTATTANTTQGMVLAGGGMQTNAYSISTTGTSTPLDAGNFASISIYINTLTSGTITFQTSDDNTNWASKLVYPTNGLFAPVTTTTFSASMFSASLGERYFRISYSGAGTTTGTIVFKSNSYAGTPGLPSVTQSGTWTVGSNSATASVVPPNAFYAGMIDGSGNLVGLGSAARANGDTNGLTNGIANANYSFNGATYDRQRNNTSVVVVAAGTTSTQTGVTVTTYNARSLVLAVNITAGAGTLTVAISGSTTSGYTYPILTSTALTGIADNTLRVFPGATPASNTAANDALPRTLSITYTVVGSITFGSDAVLSV